MSVISQFISSVPLWGGTHHRGRFSKRKVVCCKLHPQTNFTLFDRYYQKSNEKNIIQIASCPATIMILSNVATPKNCTIMRRQIMLLQGSALMLVRNSVSYVSDDCLQSVPSVCQPSNWRDFAVWWKNWSLRFPKMMFECRQSLQISVGDSSGKFGGQSTFEM